MSDIWDDWPEISIGTELHLDVDEWMAILDCISFRCKGLDEVREASYLGFLEAIRAKVAAALGVDDDE